MTLNRCAATLRGKAMAKGTALTPSPGTMSGRVIARLSDIENWFRSGYKTKEVMDLLAKDGIKMYPVKFRQLLARYGKSEGAVRRAMALESGVALPEPISRPAQPSTNDTGNSTRRTGIAAKETKPPKTAGKKSGKNDAGSSVADELKKKDARRVVFKPDPNPRDEDVY